MTQTKPAVVPFQQQQQQQLPAALGDLLPQLLASDDSLLPDLLALYPDIEDYEDSYENLIDDSLLDPRLLAAALQDPAFQQLSDSHDAAEINENVPEKVINKRFGTFKKHLNLRLIL